MLPLIPTITFQQGRYYLPYVGEETDLKSLPNLPKVSYPLLLIRDFFFIVILCHINIDKMLWALRRDN